MIKEKLKAIDYEIEFELGTYDSDNQQFALRSNIIPLCPLYIDIPVSQAKSFKESFDGATLNYDDTSLIIDLTRDGISFGKVSFGLTNGKSFSYVNPIINSNVEYIAYPISPLIPKK